MSDPTPSRPTAAVILAAGLGSRLQSVFASAPKGLLPLGGQPLLQRSLDLLRAAGITRLIVVIGHRADDYRRFFARQFPTAELVENADFARSGSMHSLYLARARVTQDCLLLESDLLYEPRALSALLAQPLADCLLVSGTTNQGDEVHAFADDAGRLRLLTKTPPAGAGRPLGEFVGITRVSRDLLTAMCRHYENSGPLPGPMHYDDCLSDLGPTRPIGLLKVGDLLWGEIDDARHLERARTRLLPALGIQDHAAHPA